jgi:single-strand DNA-binding protein
MNAVSLIGRLTGDPQLRTTPRGQSVTTLRLAIPRTRTDAAKPSAAYVDVEAWQALALGCCEHLHSGRQVAVEGRLEYREWQTTDGERRQRVFVTARTVDFLGELATPTPSEAGSDAVAA